MRRGLAACGALGLLACAFGASLAAPVTVDATLDRRSVTVGEAATLQVIVRGAPIGVDAPTLDLPSGLDVLSTGRANNFTFVDGKSAVEAIFRYQIAANAAGRYGIGPIAVHVGKETFRSLLVHLDASAAPSHLGAEPASAGTAAALFVDVAPARPWVGQPCVMRVRLVQRAPLAEDPQYTPPATPGFWSDPTGAPESYYADEHGRRVLVTETRARLYPLAPGPATIGEASATLVLAVGPRDPTPWTSARAPRHEVAVRSAPVAVDVRALPPGAPRGFNGAVGDFTPGWTADRARTSLDVPVTVRLDVRGHGNLPLLRPPELAAPDAEVFAGTMDDSLASPGGDGVGRKRFQWSALARGVGRLAVPAPRFAWFDPGAGAYRVADLPAVAIDVGPALFAGAAGGPGLPAAFAAGTDPGARAPAPWAWALGGLLIGAALVVARGGADPRAAVAARARPLEWLRAVGRTNGPDFWRAAEDASAWLATGGHDAESVRRDIAAARFGGTGIDVERVRRELVEAISAALPPRRRSAARRATAVVLVLAAAAVMTAFAPRAGDAPLAARMRAADGAAAGGDLGAARRGWASLWSDGARAPGIAARLAWAEVQSGAIGPAAAWVVRGQMVGGRDPALGWVAERVREGGGLVGDTTRRWPIRPLEWAIAAALLGAAAGSVWPRRRWTVLLALGAALAGGADPIQSAIAARIPRAVVRESVAIEGAGLDLQPGQVVRVIEHAGPRAHVAAGGGVTGWVPAASLDSVNAAP